MTLMLLSIVCYFVIEDLGDTHRYSDVTQWDMELFLRQVVPFLFGFWNTRNFNIILNIFNVKKTIVFI